MLLLSDSVKNTEFSLRMTLHVLYIKILFTPTGNHFLSESKVDQ